MPQTPFDMNLPHENWEESPQVMLHPGKSRLFYNRHPWVFPGAILSVTGSPGDGAVVALVSHNKKFVGWGFFNSKSKVRVRVYSWTPDAPPSQELFRLRIRDALRLRSELGSIAPGTACRLVNSEGDFLSGLTVDKYANWLVMQVSSLGIAQRVDRLAELIVEESRPFFETAGILVRFEKNMSRLEGLESEDRIALGEMIPESIPYEEGGIKLMVHLAGGQKTGAYLDQRTNRAQVGSLAANRTFLDAFCYAGGFGLQAAKNGATSVLCLDQSENALNHARQNAVENGFDNVMSFVKGDVFEKLAQLEEAGKTFDMVVLDPPKFAQSRSAIEEALRGYRRLYSLGMRLTAPKGYLVVCCCTGIITWDMMESLVEQVAAEARRNARIIQKSGPSPDHPISASCRESSYLKCLTLRLE